uniref:Reverse transcriptase domain-containing protein n=1 Tax=Tanacetum cinerariifolium TaxID=118510 RepID=A0A6L2P3N6_TANCI|nr:reverse transcriptase domain-containing protein [Tanacetum cinerariifolium]
MLYTKFCHVRLTTPTTCAMFGLVQIILNIKLSTADAYSTRDISILSSSLLGFILDDNLTSAGNEDSSAEEAKTESNVWHDGSEDVNPFGRGYPKYRDHRYHPRHNDHAVDRDDRYHDDPIRSLGLKIEILEFTGKVHPDDFIDWLSMVEPVFDVRDIPNKLKVKFVSIKL